MKHDEILKQLVEDAESNSNIIVFLVFGSVATGNQRANSDVDVWNELEKRHSGGKIKRRFFSSFYMTNSFIFSLLKRLM